MKRLLIFLLVLCFIPNLVYARTAIDPYGNEYEIIETIPSGFSEDDIGGEHNVTNFTTTTTTRDPQIEIEKQRKEEEKEAKKRNRKYISYGAIAIVLIVLVIIGLLFLIKATRASNLY